MINRKYLGIPHSWLGVMLGIFFGLLLVSMNKGVTVFFLICALGLFMLLLGLRLLADCAKLKADLPDYVWSLNALIVAVLLLAEAYYRCPFKVMI